LIGEKGEVSSRMANEEPEVTETCPPSDDHRQPITEGYVRLRSGDLVGAAAHFQEARRRDPTDPRATYAVGEVNRQLRNFDEARRAFHEFIRQSPLEAARAYNQLGLASVELEEFPAAEAHYRQAIEHHFQYAIAHLNLGILLLRLGRLQEGFCEFEWRWQVPGFRPFRCLQPRWKGQPLDGTLLVHSEQGAGDLMQFCRFLPQIRQRCRRLTFVCPEPMHCMFASEGFADQLLAPGSILQDSFDMYLPLMSAPFALRTDWESLRQPGGPYLTPVPRGIGLGAPHVPDSRLKVGLIWGGSPTHQDDRLRSCALSFWEPILRIEQIAFYSFQTPPQRDQLQDLPVELRHRVRDVHPLQSDFADTAAMMRQLDLILSVDTAALHLAGGLGIPVWGLIHRNCDWRWLWEREDSPWYPTLRLFRQGAYAAWEEVVQRVAAELERRTRSEYPKAPQTR
jgi:hypothetical protein